MYICHGWRKVQSTVYLYNIIPSVKVSSVTRNNGDSGLNEAQNCVL